MTPVRDKTQNLPAISNGVNILAVDASSENLSLYIRYGKGKEVDFNQRIKFGGSRLIGLIDKSLKRAKLELADFEAFVIGAGPGSFTGLRISFSLIKAFILVKEKPVIAVPSFYSCAYPFKDNAQNLAVVSDARRNLIYLSCFKSKQGKLTKDGKERLVTLDEVFKKDKSHLFITCDRHLRERILSLKPGVNFYSKDVYPQAKYLMPLAEMYYNRGKFTPLEKLEPLYLHPKTCQIRKAVSRKL